MSSEPHELPVLIREPLESDRRFILSSWLKSYIDSPDNPIQGGRYWGYQHLLIEQLLSRARVAVICEPTDPTTIFAYAVYEYGSDGVLILHWIYTKHTFRRFGCAKKIISALRADNQPVIVTHRGIEYLNLKGKLPHTFQPKKAFITP